MKQDLVFLISQQVEQYEPFDTLSFLMGFESAIRMFGVWQNGEQKLGSGDITVRQMMQAIKEFSQPNYQE